MTVAQAVSSPDLHDAERPPTAPERVRVPDLSFYYGRQKALSGINLPFYANQITAILGPSGCGKSTLLLRVHVIDIPAAALEAKLPCRRPMRVAGVLLGARGCLRPRVFSLLSPF
jgi:ABC-type molybdenum transport system ATPase subunit/photorepair protein PhrA